VGRLPKNRLLLLLVAVAVAVVAILAVVVFAGRGDSAATAETTTTSPTSTDDGAFAGVPQQGLTLGKASTPDTLYVFEDPQCPYCKQWSLDTLPSAVNEFVRTGQVKFELRSIEVIGPDSEPGIRAVYAAAQQNKAWNMSEALYERQGEEESGWITNRVIASAAVSAGANPVAIKKAMPTAAVTAQWRASEGIVQQWGVAGTPTFVLVKQLGTPEQVTPTSLDPTDFNDALRSALQ
jgi:protein-disulfide isomerase